MIKNIFTEMFDEQYERQESLFKSLEESILSTISSNAKVNNTATGKWFHGKKEENANIIERQNYDFSNTFNTFQSIQDNKIKQAQNRTEKLQEQLKSVNNDKNANTKNYKIQ